MGIGQRLRTCFKTHSCKALQVHPQARSAPLPRCLPIGEGLRPVTLQWMLRAGGGAVASGFVETAASSTPASRTRTATLYTRGREACLVAHAMSDSTRLRS